MTKEQIYIIHTALQDHINTLRYCADVRDSQGDEEARVFFLEQANEAQEALGVFLKENPA